MHNIITTTTFALLLTAIIYYRLGRKKNEQPLIWALAGIGLVQLLPYLFLPILKLLPGASTPAFWTVKVVIGSFLVTAAIAGVIRYRNTIKLS
jgi:predicted cobalt transporter CbtA